MGGISAIFYFINDGVLIYISIALFGALDPLDGWTFRFLLTVCLILLLTLFLSASLILLRRQWRLQLRNLVTLTFLFNLLASKIIISPTMVRKNIFTIFYEHFINFLHFDSLDFLRKRNLIKIIFIMYYYLNLIFLYFLLYCLLIFNFHIFNRISSTGWILDWKRKYW